MRARCSFPMCPSTPTRQTYTNAFDAAEPWEEAGYDAWCAVHAPRDSWPLVESEQ